MNALSILVVHNELPLVDLNSGSLRLRRIVELMVAQGHRVTFLGMAGIDQEACAEQLRALGVEVHPIDAQRLRARGFAIPGPGVDLPALLRRGRFDLAWLSVYPIAELYLPEIREHSPGTRIVVDTMDVCCLRERRGAELAGDPVALAAAERTREREVAVYTRADVLVAVSREDAAALGELAPDVPAHVLSNIHPDVGDAPGFDDRRGLVFVGHFDHAPNVDAVLEFHAHAWPAVRAALPDATLTIVGPKPPADVRALAGPGVVVTGWVAEVAPYLDAARVSIAPLRFGAGVKGKIGEALSHGLPVVTTPVGAEGMGLLDGEHVLVETDQAAFAAAVARLHGDRALWERLARAGRDHIAGSLGPVAADAALSQVLRASVPVCCVSGAGWDDEVALRDALGAYARRFGPEDAVSLLLPVEPSDPPLAEAFERAGRALHAAGVEPAAVADVAVVRCAARPALPAGAVRLEGLQDDSPTSPVASIVICAYGKRDVTEMCLAALEQALGMRLGADIELVLIDNASPDDTLELFGRWSDRATIVALDANRNFAGGNNAGAAAAHGRVLIFLNNDTEVRPGAIEALIEEAERPGAGIVGARLLYPDGRVQHSGFAWRSGSGRGATPFHLFEYEDGELAAARSCFDIGFVTGACMAIPRDVFDAVGGWDEAYVNGWEDADLCLRVRAAGARVRYRGDAAIVHYQGTTSDGRYDAHGNAARFAERWTDALALDDELLQRTLGAVVSPLGDAPIPADAPDGAELRLVGPVSGLGPDGAEARGFLRAFTRAGANVAARTVAPTWLGPALEPVERTALIDAHEQAGRPGAVTLHFPDAGAPWVAGDSVVLRLADVPAERRPDAQAWAATPALAEALIDAGWPAHAVAQVPPCGIDAALGAGGQGVLALLPDHDPALAEALLDALAAARWERLRIAPTARTRELAALVAARLPGAELLEPITDEAALARLAAECDVVVVADPADRFDRRALTAAAAGAAVVVRPDGAGAHVLGGHATVADPADADALAAALAAAGASTTARAERRATVHAACGPAAARRALGLLELAADPQADHAAGIEAFARGDLEAAREHLERAIHADADAELLNDLAVVCHAAGDHDRAVELLRSCLGIAPDHADARANLAQAALAAAD
jgi:GT2 family glycosyltransferase/glycosyltransferase involved in cell wall biosynthesis